MNKFKHYGFMALVVIVTVCGHTHAAVVVSGENSTTARAFTPVSGADLINSGQATLDSSSVSPSLTPNFPGTGINDSNDSDTNLPDNTFFLRSNGHFPATATYNLDVSINTLGYDITSIESFMGWHTVSAAQANQTYTVEVSLVGSATYSNIANVSYTPFADVNTPSYETKVTITEDVTGILASGVDSIRFTFADPLLAVGNGTGTTEGTLIREIDVFGTATIPEPATCVLLFSGFAGLCLHRRRKSIRK